MKISTHSSGPSRQYALLLVLGITELVLAVFAARFVGWETPYLVYLCLYLAMGIPWLLASYHAVRSSADSPTGRWLLISFALALRGPFLVTEPALSDDIFRYVWDGRVQHAGINPYTYPPEAPELAFLRNEQYEPINNKDIPTIYPPLMQAAFFVVTAISESLLWMKLFFVLADVAIIFILMRLLRSVGQNPMRALVYAWSPLVIVEVSGSGHNDVLAVAFLMAAQAAIIHHKAILSICLLTSSGLAKLAGFALLPLFARFVKPSALLAMPVLTLAIVWPYAGAGTLGFRGLIEYGLRWRANDSLFHVLYAITDSLDASKIIVAAFLVGLVVALAAVKAPPLRSSFMVLGAILLLTPTVHPWYLLWIVPFLSLYPSPAWMYLTLSVGLSYHAAHLAEPGEPWEELLWVKALEYVPFFGLAIWSLARSLRRDRDAVRHFLGID